MLRRARPYPERDSFTQVPMAGVLPSSVWSGPPYEDFEHGARAAATDEGAYAPYGEPDAIEAAEVAAMVQGGALRDKGVVHGQCRETDELEADLNAEAEIEAELEAEAAIEAELEAAVAGGVAPYVPYGEEELAAKKSGAEPEVGAFSPAFDMVSSSAWTRLRHAAAPGRHVATGLWRRAVE